MAESKDDLTKPGFVEAAEDAQRLREGQIEDVGTVGHLEAAGPAPDRLDRVLDAMRRDGESTMFRYFKIMDMLFLKKYHPDFLKSIGISSNRGPINSIDDYRKMRDGHGGIFRIADFAGEVASGAACTGIQTALRGILAAMEKYSEKMRDLSKKGKEALDKKQ